MRQQPTRLRDGFTLVEILVALGIILILASLTVAFLPTLNDRQRATQGAAQLQNVLATARHRALRDHAPRGVRLLTDDTSAPNYPNPDATHPATSLQFIEQPEDLTGGAAQVTFVPATATSPATATIKLMPFVGQQPPDLFGGFGSSPTNQRYWAVQQGDYFVLSGNNTFYITSSPSSSTGGSVGDTFTISAQGSSSALTASIPSANNYQIVRAPRGLTADDPMKLPDKVGIDLAANRSLVRADSHGGQFYYDILFDSSGRLLRQNLTTGKVILWVRDVTDPNMGGDQTLITVYTRSGLVVPAQVDPGPNNDFNNTFPDVNSGAYFYNATLTQSPYTYALQGQGAGL